jgi:hypothetical protein
MMNEPGKEICCIADGPTPVLARIPVATHH